MPQKLLPNQWAIHFEKCFLCGTSSKEGRSQHASKGVCIYCYKKLECRKHKKGIVRPKKWYKNYWEKIRNDPVAKKRYQEHCRNWRKTSKVFKRYLKRRNAKIRYINHIKRKERQRKQWMVIKLIKVLNSRIADIKSEQKATKRILDIADRKNQYIQYIEDWFNGKRENTTGILFNLEYKDEEYLIRLPFKRIIGWNYEREFRMFVEQMQNYIDSKLSTYGGVDGG